jgi:hypothetical protein
VSLTDDLQATLSSLEVLHRRQNEAQIRNYCRRVERMLTRVIDLLDGMNEEEAQTVLAGSSQLSVGSPAYREALRRWASRVSDQLTPSTLNDCDPRLEQSLLDLTTMLEVHSSLAKGD